MYGLLLLIYLFTKATAYLAYSLVIVTAWKMFNIHPTFIQPPSLPPLSDKARRPPYYPRISEAGEGSFQIISFHASWNIEFNSTFNSADHVMTIYTVIDVKRTRSACLKLLPVRRSSCTAALFPPPPTGK